MSERVYDCIIIGAGPGGLQAGIYLGRYNRSVLLLDRSGGRTWHAKQIENVLALPVLPGSAIIERGVEQVKRFGVRIERARVTAVRKVRDFIIETADATYRSRTVIVSTGVQDIFPPLKNLHRFLGAGYYTCIDCDGLHMTGKKVAIIGNSLQIVNLSFALRRLYTKDVTCIPYDFVLSDAATEILKDEGVPIDPRKPSGIAGSDKVIGVEFRDGGFAPYEAIMASFGIRLNDEFLTGLDLAKDSEKFRYRVNSVFESSLSGLYIVGPLNTGQDQVVIAAGEGATAAIDINKRLLEEDM